MTSRPTRRFAAGSRPSRRSDHPHPSNSILSFKMKYSSYYLLPQLSSFKSLSSSATLPALPTPPGGLPARATGCGLPSPCRRPRSSPSPSLILLQGRRDPRAAGCSSHSGASAMEDSEASGPCSGGRTGASRRIREHRGVEELPCLQAPPTQAGDQRTGDQHGDQRTIESAGAGEATSTATRGPTTHPRPCRTLDSSRSAWSRSSSPRHPWRWRCVWWPRWSQCCKASF
jgi:hypothetical protein